MSGEIEWGEPPTNTRGGGQKGVWAERLAPFRERPGQWGKLPGSFNGGMPNHIRTGKLAGIPAGEFDAKARNAHEADGKVRYIGEAVTQ